MTSKRLGKARNIGNKKGAGNSDATKSRGDLKFGDVIWVKIRNSLWWPVQVVDENMVSTTSKPKKKLMGEVLVRLYGTYKYLYFDPKKYCSEFEKILKENNGSYKEILQKSLEKDISYRLKKRGSEPREKLGAEAPKDKKAKQGESRNSSTQPDLGKSPDVSTHKSKSRKSEASTYRKTKQDGAKKNSKGDQEASVGGSPGKLMLGTPKSKAIAESFKSKSPKQGATNGRNNSKGPAPSPDMSARRIRVMQSLGLVPPCGSPFLSNGLKLSIS